MPTVSIALTDSIGAAAHEFLSAELLSTLRDSGDIRVSGSPPDSESDFRQRLTGLEVFATFLTSASAVTLAKAIRDFVKRKKLEIVMKAANADELRVTSSGDNDDAAIAQIVGYLCRAVPPSADKSDPQKPK